MNIFKRMVRSSLAIAAVLSAPIGAVAAGTPGEVILGTATKGGGFQLFGSNLAAVINEADPGLRVKAIATKGSRENLKLLQSGRIHIGLVEGNAARLALDGIGRPRANLRVLSVMYPNPGMFVVRADSPYRTIDDLRGKPIAFGTRASGLRILATDVLDGLGLEPDRDFQQIILGKAAEGPKLVLSGKAEALWGAGIGWPGFVQVANGPKGGRFIPPSAAQLERILTRHPHLRRMSVPAGTYRGQDLRVDSVGLWSLILVRPDVPEETVYRLAKALHQGEGPLVKRLAQGRYTTSVNTAREVPVERLHPGAARFLRELAGAGKRQDLR